MIKDSFLKDLTSPNCDRQVMTELAAKLSLNFYAFVNLTGDQMKKVGKAISKVMKKEQVSSLVLHYSGHGAKFASGKKKDFKLCFLGVDAKKNGDGAISLLGLMRKEGICDAFALVIADCCRVLIEDPDENKGESNSKTGEMIIYTCADGTCATAKKNQPSEFSKALRDYNFDSLDNEYDGDLVALFKDMAHKTNACEVVQRGGIPKILFGETKKIQSFRDILKNIGESFVEMEHVFRKSKLTSLDRLKELTDQELGEDILFSKHQIKEWRREIPYGEGSWQRALYDCNYAKFVIKFEENTIESLEEITELEDHEITELTKVKGSMLKKFRRKLLKAQGKEQVETPTAETPKRDPISPSAEDKGARTDFTPKRGQPTDAEAPLTRFNRIERPELYSFQCCVAAVADPFKHDHNVKCLKPYDAEKELSAAWVEHKKTGEEKSVHVLGLMM
eukprot:UN23396